MEEGRVTFVSKVDLLPKKDVHGVRHNQEEGSMVCDLSAATTTTTSNSNNKRCDHEDLEKKRGTDQTSNAKWR